MMTGPSDNEPWRHHYVPEFYLKRWTNPKTGKLVEFSKPYGPAVKWHWKAPRGTGWSRDLYLFERQSGGDSRNLENSFFSPIDSKANKALLKMVQDRVGDLTEAERRAWEHFILVMLMRVPESIQALTRTAMTQWDNPHPSVEARYVATKPADAPDSLRDFLAITDVLDADTHISIFIEGLAQNHAIMNFIGQMSWGVISFPDDAPDLMTSDRCVVMPDGGLKNDSGHIAIPLGPKHLFIATSSDAIEREIRGMNYKDLATRNNWCVTVRAHKFVWSNSTDQHPNISELMGTVPGETIGETLERQWIEGGWEGLEEARRRYESEQA